MRLSHRGGRLWIGWTRTATLTLLTVGSLFTGSLTPTRAQQAPNKSGGNKTGGLFVAVGYGGRRMSSPDGLHWENDTEWEADGGDDEFCLFSIVFAQGKFFATGGGASTGHVLVTRDGKNWKEVYKANTRIIPILYGNGRFVVGTGHDFQVSADGERWQPGGTLSYDRGLYFRRAAFGNGVFVFCGDCDIAPGQPRGGWRATTADGKTISAFVTDLPNTRSLAFGAGRFVLVGEHGYRAVSTDGKTWQAASDPAEDFHWVFWTGKQFILSGNAVYTSPDGLTWTKTDKNIPCEPVCAGNGAFLGCSWKTNLWRSTDGLNWERVSTSGTNAFTSAAFGQPR